MHQTAQRTNNSAPWFTNYGLATHGSAQIFAFPYSGAGANAFYHWAQDLRDTDIDFLGMSAPGRESRISEPLVNNMTDLIDQLVHAIKPLLVKPFVFFGHSLGGLVAFELSRALQVKGLPAPQRLFISAIRAPNRPSPNPTLHDLPDDQFMQAVNAYGGTSQALLNNPELIQFFLPVLRNDFALNETYQYQKEPLLHCPMTIFSGSDDPYAKPDFMSLWQEQTESEFNQIIYPGGHFFLHEQRIAMLKHMQDSLIGEVSF